MMDKDTQRRINQINASIPKELTKNLVKVEKDTSQHEMAQDALSSNRLSKEGRRALEKAVAEGKLVSETKVYDQEKTKRIDEYLDGKIKAEMASGRLKPAQRDDWMRKMEYQQRKIRK